jgi:hypothetical protein
MAVDPRSGTVSAWAGAIVGKFVVGDGTKVGPPVFQPAKSKLTLRGKHFVVNIAGDLKQVTPPKAKMRLSGESYALAASSTVAPTAGVGPLLILRGKSGVRIVTPGRQVTGKPKLTLRGKHFNRVTSMTVTPKIPKLILRGGELGRVGKAGLVPTVPADRPLTPSPALPENNLVPTPAYTDGLLVPTVERTV